ncbi:hypothetical protein HRR83_005233 [Exophiala dermatitidis]|uniref:Uncharacterized protein n=1 Tax=Exophiala dermatitidis TaxID=5970 RepID=A0AAN6IYC7_EXODE|nr:hypothetical protein HRR75_004658 [Exophiala dermatitidis]KAJ4515928.1 hypothetical protein HRR74_005085 [Exophiala dermatitidis]KAJ4518666.1 hypothetical protein HRR73_004247 [Exophiala dermatitidis]KAJ4534179.1 hypothetical protein HRR76_006113 [Exophiala dermatitidis]KAJ4545922.1 hypothetical protein HRR78_005761 [Exophiala dermatitidis]
MVTTRSQEKKSQKTPKSLPSSSQNGSSKSAAAIVSTPTRQEPESSPRFFTPATSKKPRFSNVTVLIEKAGATDTAKQHDVEEEPTRGHQSTATSSDQPETTTPTASAKGLDETVMHSVDEETPSSSAQNPSVEINLKLPERLKPTEKYFTPMTTNKRKRFNSERLDDSTQESLVVEEQTPTQPGGQVREVPDTDDDDDDDAPETISSKVAVRQALKGRTPPSRGSARKRQKTTTQPTTGATPSESATEPASQKEQDGLSHSPSAELENESAVTRNSTTSVIDPDVKPSADTTGDTPFPSNNDQENQADADLVSTNSTAAAVASTTNDAETTVAFVQLDASASVGAERGTPDDGRQDNLSTSQANPSVDQDSQPETTPFISAAPIREDANSKEVRRFTTAGLDSRDQAQRHELSLARTGTSAKPSRSHRQVPRMPMPETKAKMSSLQEYRKTLMNRHQRTSNFGQRRVKFVGV